MALTMLVPKIEQLLETLDRIAVAGERAAEALEGSLALQKQALEKFPADEDDNYEFDVGVLDTIGEHPSTKDR